MHLPTTAHIAAGPATASTAPSSYAGIWIFGKKGGYDENWSSLIGIVTAIVGNVLISFALNTQRYAHLRLDREWQEKERQRKRRVASSSSIPRLAGEGSKNGVSLRDGEASANGGDANGFARNSVEASESDPLIPQSPELGRGRPSLERQGSESSGDEEAYKQKSYLKSPYWWAGIIMMTIGEAGNFLAYGFAPASIVSPLGVVALISNCIIAPLVLKEPFRMRDALGVIIAVGGAVTVVLSANDNNPKLGPGEIWRLISTWEFETYFGITVAVIAILMFASNKYGEKSILIDLGLVGLFGGYTALSTKGVSSLLSYTLWRVITFPVFYLLVAILVGTAIMQIKYVNRALQRFDATQVIPVQFVLFTLSVILGSAVLYRDFERTSGEDAGKFVGGCAMTFLGVGLITSGRPRRQRDEEDRDPEPEDAIHLAGERYQDEIDDTIGEIDNTQRRTSTLRSASPIKSIQPYRDEEDSRPSTPTNPTNSRPQRDRATTDMPSSILANPWVDSNDSTEPPSILRHTSTPVLPSEVAPLPVASVSDPEVFQIPQTPPRNKTHPEVPLTPGTTPQLRRLRTSERVGTIGRNSLTGPFLASPLSTTLSAMVQDMQRGGGIRNREADGSVRRRGSVLGLEPEGTDGEIGEPISRRRTVDEPERTPGRERSLSGTLNGFLRGIRGTPSRESLGREAGEETER